MSEKTKAQEPDTREVRDAIEIAAGIEQVWRALTEGAELERWFAPEARVVPGEGGEVFLSWGNEYAGSARIEAWEPPHRLRTSSAFAGEGGGLEATEYVLEARGGKTVLRVVTSGIPAGADWDDWYEGTRRGWRFELASLKHYLERHPGEPRHFVYLRRRVAMDPAEAWRRATGPGGWGDLPGRLLDEDEGLQRTAVLDRPADALLRVSVEPSLEPPARDVTLWLAAWGDHAGELAALRAEWLPRLERLFPEGKTV